MRYLLIEMHDGEPAVLVGPLPEQGWAPIVQYFGDINQEARLGWSVYTVSPSSVEEMMRVAALDAIHSLNSEIDEYNSLLHAEKERG